MLLMYSDTADYFSLSRRYSHRLFTRLDDHDYSMPLPRMRHHARRMQREQVYSEEERGVEAFDMRHAESRVIIIERITAAIITSVDDTILLTRDMKTCSAIIH